MLFKRITASVPLLLLLLGLTAAPGLAEPQAAAAPRSAPAAQPRPDTLYQLSTLEALLAGVYDGQTTFGQLAARGDLGLGTFNALDGEMIAIDGRFYQVKVTGQVLAVHPTAKCPFANLAFFRPEKVITIKGPISLEDLKKRIDQELPSGNLFYAVRVTGRFAKVKVRSVPAQKRPYPPLVQAVKHQAVWELAEVDGDLVGFRFPPYVQGLNVTGYHLHFINAARDKGGHLLDGVIGKEVVVKVDILYSMDLDLPHSGDFLGTGLGKDTKAAVHAVE